MKKQFKKSYRLGILAVALLVLVMFGSAVVAASAVSVEGQQITAAFLSSNINEYGPAKGTAITASEMLVGGAVGAAAGKAVGRAIGWAARKAGSAARSVFKSAERMMASKTGSVGGGFTQTFKDTAKSKIGKEEWVNVNELYTRQTWLDNYDHYTDKFMSEGTRNVEPIFITEVNGRKIISNGNHRWNAAKDVGVSKIKAIYLDAQEVADAWGDANLETFYQKSHKGDKYVRG